MKHSDSSNPLQKRDSPIDTAGGNAAKPVWVGGAVVLGVVVLLILVAVTDISELGRVFAGADLRYLTLALFCVAASYVTMALSYHGIARAAGGDIHFGDMLKITLVANSLNYLLATGGLSGFAARMYYFTKRSIPPATSVVISLAQTFLTNITLLAFILLGFFYVATSHELAGAALASTIVMLVLFLVIAFGGSILLLNRRLRRQSVSIIAVYAHRILRRVRPKSKLSRISLRRYQATIERGIEFLMSRKKRIAAPLFFIILDWVFTILILHTSFIAVHHAIPFSHTVVGFSVGIVLSFVSLIPGGLGVMEGSMAAIFAGMGVPFETAVAAVLLFRAIYYIAPLGVSVLFLHDMLDQVRRGAPS